MRDRLNMPGSFFFFVVDVCWRGGNREAKVRRLNAVGRRSIYPLVKNKIKRFFLF